MANVLIVDDEPNIRRMVGALLSSEGYEVRDAPDGRSALAFAREAEPDVLLLDLMMPGDLDGMATLEQLREAVPDVPVIMMSGKAGLADAVRATRLGAFNFLEKPLSPESVLLAMRAAIELRQARREAKALREAVGWGEMVGESPAIRQVRELIRRVAPTDTRVLITGESGTGKELVAAALHEGSPRRERPFVRVNCAAIPRDLVESEMFGHEKGAFTGATERRIGRFELAHGGTLFLDEVGDLGPEAQAKLLRSIEAGEIERVGGGQAIRVNVRIVAATNKDLTQATAAGGFREDLLFRLNVMPIPIPPLRERPSDVPLLVRHFVTIYRARSGRPPAIFGDEALAAFSRYAWPGNVRELANIMERLGILYSGRLVTEREIGAILPLDKPHRTLDAPLPDPGALESSLSETLDEYERVLITRTLSMSGGNVAEAARRLKTDRPNLYRRMRRLGIAGGAGSDVPEKDEMTRSDEQTG